MSTTDRYLDFERPILDLEERIRALRDSAREGGIESLAEEIAEVEAKLDAAHRELADRLTPWQRTQLARHPMRPGAMDLAGRAFEEILPLHGDRLFAEDRAIEVALASFRGREILLVAQVKGHDAAERVRHNFGMAHPEGYRKTMRLLGLAERFRRPVVSLIDTPGAYPGIGAEERGQAWAVAESIDRWMRLDVPSVGVVVGEGGSGGALAVGVTDRVLMMENAIYSVISPEGCASILFRDAARAPEAAAAMKVTARDAFALKVIDAIVEEPPGGAHRDLDDAARRLGDAIAHHLDEISGWSVEERRRRRYDRFRAIGVFREAEA
jgi:acetyl-CoA carboxylase carboxyl transferase subunit alpha